MTQNFLALEKFPPEHDFEKVFLVILLLKILMGNSILKSVS